MKPQKTLQLGALTCLLAFASLSTFAAETTDLSVRGTIKPPSCDVTLSNDGQIDFGKISAPSLSDTQATVLPDQALQLLVNCQSPSRYMFHVVNNRQIAVDASVVAALQQTEGIRTSSVVSSANRSLGAIALFPGSGTADGSATTTIESLNEGKDWSTWNAAKAAVVYPASDDYIGWSIGGGTTPSAITNLAEDFTVRLAINPKSKLPDLSKDLDYTGSVTFNIRYL